MDATQAALPLAESVVAAAPAAAAAEACGAADLTAGAGQQGPAAAQMEVIQLD